MKEIYKTKHYSLNKLILIYTVFILLLESNSKPHDISYYANETKEHNFDSNISRNRYDFIFNNSDLIELTNINTSNKDKEKMNDDSFDSLYKKDLLISKINYLSYSNHSENIFNTNDKYNLTINNGLVVNINNASSETIVSNNSQMNDYDIDEININNNIKVAFNSSKILPIMFEAFINFSENFYAYSQFWDQYNLKVSNEKFSLFLCVFLLSMLTFPLIKPYLVFFYYTIKFFCLLLAYIYCFLFNRKSKYFSLERTYQQSFKRYLPVNFYMTKSNKGWILFNLIIYGLFLNINILFFIFFFIDLSKKNSASDISQTSTEVKVFKILATYFHLFIEFYVIFYYLIDPKSEQIIDYYKGKNNTNKDYYNLVHNVISLKKKNKNAHTMLSSKHEIENPLKTKLIFAFIPTLSLLLIIIFFSFIVAMVDQDSVNAFNNNKTFFILFKLLCLIKEVVLIYLYLLNLNKFFKIIKLKMHWNNFLILKVQNVEETTYKKNMKRFYNEKYINNKIIKEDSYKSLVRRKECQEMDIDDNFDKKKYQLKSTDALILLEKEYFDNKLKSENNYNSKETYYNSRILKQIKKSIVVKNKNNICNEIPYIPFFDTISYNKEDLEISEFYNTRSKYFYIKYVKYFSFPMIIVINLILCAYTLITLTIGLSSSMHYLSNSLFSYLIVRFLICFMSLFVFFNTWVVYMKFEWRNLWLSD